jgi:UDP-N-acetylglucosamine--N-acetylmuramyl-(pentapeptide) pyrophosphoryl-undecaprenol N-acetylglucosamine transferase
VSERLRFPVVIAAGGTGGHLFPAEALAQELKRRGHPVVLVTDERGRSFAENFPADEVIGVKAATFAGRGPLGRVMAGISILTGIAGARAALKRLTPLAVVGFGGYPSLPAMAAAILGGVPCCIHEQNAVLGRVNRRLAPFVTAVASTFPSLKGLSSRAGAKLVVTGNPVRDAVIAKAGAPYAAPGKLGDIKLLVFGGSQGAQFFAKIMPEALAQVDPAITRRLHIVQQARPEDGDTLREVYAKAGIAAEIAPFFKNLPERMAAAHLIIGRGGASTICELAVIGRPALIVPLPSAMDDHQTFNAKYLVDAGAAVLLKQRDITAEALAAELTALLGDPARLDAAAAAARQLGRPDATQSLADLVETLRGQRAQNPARPNGHFASTSG